jgi:hypothetical protein
VLRQVVTTGRRLTLGLPIPARPNMTDIIEAVCGVGIDTSASMVLIDEIHSAPRGAEKPCGRRSPPPVIAVTG